MKYFHNDVYDNGLNTIINATGLILVILSQPTTLRIEAATLYDGTVGKYRVSDEIAVASTDLTLADKVGGGREITVAAKSGTALATLAAGNDLHFALYDGTRLLAVSDETTNQSLTNGNPISTPSFKLGFNTPI